MNTGRPVARTYFPISSIRFSTSDRMRGSVSVLIFQMSRGPLAASAWLTASSSAESSFHGKSAYFTRIIVGIWCTISSMDSRLAVTLA